MPDSVRYHEVDAKSVLRRSALVDPWFLGRFGSNLYRGCQHGCIYCDGRAERYYVSGDFERDIQIKRNAVELAAAELGRMREPGFLFIGGGVSDAYQPAEARHRLTRGLLELCRDNRTPVHVLTKSGLVKRDLELLAAINTETRAVLSFSIAMVDEHHREIFEPGATPLDVRWNLLAAARKLGLATGVMAMPVLPGLSDTPDAIGALVAKAAEIGVDFVCYGGLTLRPGKQKDGFFRVLGAHYPDLVAGYEKLFAHNRASGIPDVRYLARVDERFRKALGPHALPARMPHRVFHGVVPLYTEVAVLLEHRGWQQGEPSGGNGRLARAGWAIATWAQARLSRQRGKNAYREVESEFAMLARSGQLREIGGIDEASIIDVKACFAMATENPE